MNGHVKIFREAAKLLAAKDPNALAILSLAASRASFKDNPMTGLKRGEAFLGHTDFSFSRDCYREAIKRIKKYKFATIKTNNKGTTVSLQGYGFADYLPITTPTRTPIQPPSSPHQAPTNEDVEDVEDVKIKHLSAYTDDFEQFWKAYPKKTGKGAVFKIWKKLPAAIRPTITAHVQRRRKTDLNWIKDKGQFIPNPQTFLNQGRWEDEYEAIAGTRTKPKKEITETYEYGNGITEKEGVSQCPNDLGATITRLVAATTQTRKNPLQS